MGCRRKQNVFCKGDSPFRSSGLSPEYCPAISRTFWRTCFCFPDDPRCLAMKTKFKADPENCAAETAETRVADPEALDASDMQFTANAGEKPVAAAPRFLPDAIETAAEPIVDETASDKNVISTTGESDGAADSELQPEGDDKWRQEVASRVSRYRARRRGRGPRYPSLQLHFETTETSWQAGATARTTYPVSTRLSTATRPEFVSEPPTSQANDTNQVRILPDPGAKILEFPRIVPPPPRLDELADPVFDRPRIIEAPEIVPPPPALGGILMEPAEEAGAQRRRGFELPLQTAPMSRRLIAIAVDCLLVGVALAGFDYGFFRMTSFVPPPAQIAGISSALLGIFWFSYQYLLLVFCGTTPGLKVAKLHLSRFDGTAVPRRLRRWRILASALAGLSLGLGYAWCFLDEDRLCWHDRITRTYMAPGAKQVTELTVS